MQIAKSGGYKIVDNWWSHYTCKWNIHQLSAISYPPLLAICTLEVSLNSLLRSVRSDRLVGLTV